MKERIFDMTLARKLYRLMVPGRKYHMDELLELLMNAERDYMDSDPDIEDALNEEWLEAVQSANLRQRVKEALAITRKFGYTEVVVEVTPAHDFTGTIRSKGKYGIGYTRKKTYHYGEYKDFTYRRVK